MFCVQIDSKKYDNSAAYLKLPQIQQDVENKTMIGQTAPSSNKQRSIQTGAFSLNMSDSFHIQTLVCSTKLTHNSRWRGFHALPSSHTTVSGAVSTLY